MSVSIQDLQPKPFTIKVKGVELTSKPLRMKHALILAKLGNIFEDSSKATEVDIETAQSDIDKVFADLIPELAGIELDMANTMEVLTQLMEQISPDDNKELSEKGVSLNTDPKV